jgi:putative redox protein
MEVKIYHLGGVKFAAQTRGHRVVSDQPATNGGSDNGMTPPELLLASLGTCAGFYAAQYFRNHALSCPELEIVVSAEKAKQPARVGSFAIDVTAPGIAAEHEAGLLRAVHGCLIHNTLLNTPSIETRVHCGTAAEARYNPV